MFNLLLFLKAALKQNSIQLEWHTQLPCSLWINVEKKSISKWSQFWEWGESRVTKKLNHANEQNSLQ